ncbi:MAG TPA: hypothetical protein ENL00_02805 [Nitratifractor sp.]|nr:hypothetical protein [Nitratifractor sp.]
MHIKSQLTKIITDALNQLGVTSSNITVTEATKPEFGDYQYNGAMALAKELKSNPREIANKIADIIKTNPIFSDVSVAGPGFLHLTLESTFIAKNLPLAINEKA